MPKSEAPGLLWEESPLPPAEKLRVEPARQLCAPEPKHGPASHRSEGWPFGSASAEKYMGSEDEKLLEITDLRLSKAAKLHNGTFGATNIRTHAARAVLSANRAIKAEGLASRVSRQPARS